MPASLPLLPVRLALAALLLAPAGAGLVQRFAPYPKWHEVLPSRAEHRIDGVLSWLGDPAAMIRAAGFHPPVGTAG